MPSAETAQRFEQLASYVGERCDGRWLVLTHDNPDPDALASAVGLGHLLRKHFRCRVTLAYAGIIGRAENQEMVRSLKLELSRLSRLQLSNYKHFALVDTQPRTGNNQLPDDVIPDVVVDHHPRRKETTQAGFFDIRKEYGATASIVAEYLEIAGLRPTHRLATALVYAIRSETQAFSRESPGPDQRIYDSLLPLASKRLLGKIIYPPLPIDYLRTLHQALSRLEGVQNVILCHLDAVPQPDIIPEIADLLLRLEGRTWCLTTGVFESRLYLALRTTNPRADAGKMMRRMVGRKGKGGGHSMIAGGWFPLEDQDPGAAAAAQALLTRRMLRQLRRDPKKVTPIPITNS